MQFWSVFEASGNRFIRSTIISAWQFPKEKDRGNETKSYLTLKNLIVFCAFYVSGLICTNGIASVEYFNKQRTGTADIVNLELKP
jgi:hypothetical protein